MPFKKILLTFFLIGSSLIVYSQIISSEMIKKVDSFFMVHHTPHSPGGAFAIIKNGTVILKKQWA